MPTEEHKEWKIRFYRDARARRPVEDFLDQLQTTERAIVDRYIDLLLEFGPQLPRPYADSLSGHKPLRELRPGNIRLIYFLHKGDRFVVLHAFRKKWHSIPSRYIKKARRRMDELLESEG